MAFELAERMPTRYRQLCPLPQFLRGLPSHLPCLSAQLYQSISLQSKYPHQTSPAYNLSRKTYISCHLLLTFWHSLPSILSPAHNKSPVPSYPPSQPPHCSFSPLFQHLHYQISVSFHTGMSAFYQPF